MIRLKPIATAQTFSIIPSSYLSLDLNAATLSLKENGTNKEEADVSFSWALSSNGNYVEITATPTITLVEGQTYTLSLSTVTDLLYKDLVYITTKDNKKEVFSLPDTYEEYDLGETEYIVL